MFTTSPLTISFINSIHNSASNPILNIPDYVEHLEKERSEVKEEVKVIMAKIRQII